MNANWSGCPQVCLEGKLYPFLFYFLKEEKETGQEIEWKANIIFPLYHLESPRWPITVEQCTTKEYCCVTSSSTRSCCSDGLWFNLSVPTPYSKDKIDVTKRVPIGAAVGGAVGGFVMIGGAAGAWLYRRKKKVKQEKEATAQSEISGPPEMKQVLEMGAESVIVQKCIYEADTKVPSTVAEMDSTVVYELVA
jgi:hypothetical protein